MDLTLYVDPGTVPIHERPSSKSMSHVVESWAAANTFAIDLFADTNLT